MKRRNFIKNVSMGGLVLGLSLDTFLNSCTISGDENNYYYSLVSNLLRDWCDGMINRQIIDPTKPELHGALDCPSCEHIHGRCMDAVYPFLYMADTSGDQKYIDAAILVMDWAENNVSQPNGSWSVIPNPKSWKGITVFGAIALAEALHYHGHVLDESIHKKWTKRLEAATEYVYSTFDLTFTNINYGGTAIYALNIIGKMLNNEKYIARSRELASGMTEFFTKPNYFLLGEGKPSQKKSGKGLYAIDLGYNVEETLSNLVLYAVEENDEELIAVLKKSLDTHLEFMLPDGAWDNSWGTRQFKWSYWGSRTCDGSQLTYACMAQHNPAYFTAAIRNTELLKRCTGDGLIHGGPHYISSGIKPCIHHTFEHAKPLASLLNNWKKFEAFNSDSPLPREKEYGIKYFPEIDTALMSRGPWRGTVTAYDAIYYKGTNRQATGGALSVLYHSKVGLLFAASMAKYQLAEKNNQQPNPGEDFALTPRVETFVDDEWYTNLFDLTASIKSQNEEGFVGCTSLVKLKNEAQEIVKGTASEFTLNYESNTDRFVIKARAKSEINSPTALILPIISEKDEKVEVVSKNELKIFKAGGTVRIKSEESISLLKNPQERVFNMVPGAEALPVAIQFTEAKTDIKVEIDIV